ncbi:hypothetical protein [Gottfriedia luciferensis]|uniref:hypothetical protein n=1 Tax=Gottfriedia luciferensis TaxID=178774 RepID=UPI000B43F275|nr:hypothetical protein [Gottfriedia luciferensis]
MLKKIFTIIATFSILSALMMGCEKEVLKSRSINDADHYIQNNISQMNWKTFKQLTSSNATITKDDFIKLKSNLSQNKSAYFFTSNSTLKVYNYNSSNHIIYISKWVDEKGLTKLKSVEFLN